MREVDVIWLWAMVWFMPDSWSLILRGSSPFGGFPGGTRGKESACQCRRYKFYLWIGKILWSREWQPTPLFLLGNPMDRGAWWPTVHGVAESWTWLSAISIFNWRNGRKYWRSWGWIWFKEVNWKPFAPSYFSPTPSGSWTLPLDHARLVLNQPRSRVQKRSGPWTA